MMKTEMGILCFECLPTKKVYLKAVKDTRGGINGLKSRFSSNMFRGSRNKNIQSDWNEYGEDQFVIKVVDTLDYDEDETKVDYSEELELLLDDWVKKYHDAEVIL